MGEQQGAVERRMTSSVRRLREAVGVAIGGIALFLFISLIT
jgi:hypothetical protein